MRNQKGFAPIVVVLVVLGVVAVGLAYYHFASSHSQAYFQDAMPGGETHYTSLNHRSRMTPVAAQIPVVKSAQDLNTLTNDLNNTNLDDINQGLSQNDSDSSSL